MQTDSEKLFKKLNNSSIFIMVIIMVISIYFYYYGYFIHYNTYSEITNSFLLKISNTGLFKSPYYLRVFSLILALLFIAPATTKKDEKAKKNTIFFHTIFSSLVFISSAYLYQSGLYIYSISYVISLFYLIRSYSKIGSLFSNTTTKDRYNLQNKVFKQMTDKIENKISVNIPYEFIKDYKYNKRKDEFNPIIGKGYINIVAPDRATIIIGKPGSGKSYSFNEEFLRQHIIKGFSILNYDYKFPALTNVWAQL